MVQHVIIVGAGLVGSLAAIVFAKRHIRVSVIEKREDIRHATGSAGRSINLALSARGLAGLELAGMADLVLAHTVPMCGRMLHRADGRLESQPYGLHGEAIHSVDRRLLNAELISEVEQLGDRVAFYFEAEITDLDLEAGRVGLRDRTGRTVELAGDLIIGADGAYSAVRRALMKLVRMDYAQTYAPIAYKELVLPAGPEGTPVLDASHLHIWPRGNHMLIALPNEDNSFTCTLFLPHALFAALDAPGALLPFLQHAFPDFVALMGPDFLEREYAAHPVGSLMSIKCSPYHYRDRAILLGDAIHAMVPFYGQGMNAGFEDVRLLAQCLDEMPGTSLEPALAAFSARRAPDAAAICDLARENFDEMSAGVLSLKYRIERRIIGWLARLAPRIFMPQYSMVSFTTVPYAEVVARRDWQRRTLWRMLLVGTGAISVGGLLLARHAFHARLR